MLCVGDSLFKMAPSTVHCLVYLSPGKTVMCPTEKIHGIDKLHAGMRYSVVCDFNVNESIK